MRQKITGKLSYILFIICQQPILNLPMSPLKFVFSKETTKISKIFTVDLTIKVSKSQKHFSWNSIAQKRMKYLTKFCPMELGQNFVTYLVRFLGNGDSRKNAFEIYWPLHNVKSTMKISLIFVAFLEHMKFKNIFFLKIRIRRFRIGCWFLKNKIMLV